MNDFLEVLVVGLGNGAIYAMLGLGLVVIYRSTGLLNFAQGELAMFSTFIVWTIWNAGVPMWLAIIGGMFGGFLIGILLHQVAVSPLGDPHEKPLAVVIVTIGLFLALNGAAQLIWGTVDKRLPPLFGTGQVTIGGVSIQWQKIGSLLVLAAMVGLFLVLFQRTKVGLAMRAVASNSESAGLCGVPVPRILMLGWGLAAATGTVAGVFTAPQLGLGTNLMQLTLIFGFAAITLGGFDSILGAVVGGMVVGVLSSIVPQYVSAFERMPLAPAFILILAVLLFRPQGLFGSKQVQRV
ncbi:MAG: branched-chain amino acid ABC transporter permease [Microthrixaceae bacterium]|nr:branched-chain amino acid ABC transporter permease [Microthrixaceae bacterium]MCO5322683.1 branched-chain amino acid ABC transporter permease [Microthrixaceae bacterium]